MDPNVGGFFDWPQEVERLRDEVASLESQVEDLEAKLAEAEADTKRMEWLSRKGEICCSHIIREADIHLDLTEAEHDTWLSGEWSSFRDAIDAARAAEQKD